jgi:hypothetical protein
MNVNNADVNLANDFAKLRDMKNELRRLEESISRRAERSPVTAADEARMLDDQARADSAYQAANRRAPPALPLEQPSAYRRRLADGVKAYSPRWQQADLASMPDDALAVVEQQIYADAVANGRTHGLKPHEIRERLTESGGGHKVIEFYGGEEAHFTRQFSRPPRLGVLKSQAEYTQMSRDANMARIDQIIRQRPVPQPLRTGF